jgi:Family of unknown function (DUF6459)
MPPTMWRSVQPISIPDGAPAYDCETHGAACPAARDHAGSADEPGTTRLPGPVAWAAEPQPQPSGQAAAASGPTAPGLSGTTTGWPRQFAQVMVEILAGVRPQRQIDPLTTDRVRAQLRHLGPILAADRRPRVQRVVTSRPAAGVVEMTVVVSFGPRSRALAMRLEYVAAREAAPGLPTRPARWLCTELETG